MSDVCDNHLAGEFGGPDHWCTEPLGHRGWHQDDDGVTWRALNVDHEVEWRVTWVRIVDGHTLSSREYSEDQARKLARDIAAGIPQRYRDVRVQRRTVTPWVDADEPEGRGAGSEERD